MSQQTLQPHSAHKHATLSPMAPPNPVAPMSATGCALPDWAPYKYLLIGWPERGDTWREAGRPGQLGILNYATAVLWHTTSLFVVIVMDDRHAMSLCTKERLKEMCGRFGERIRVWRTAMDDCWIRDTGPVMLDGGCGACFRFNAWGGGMGGCYGEYGRDLGVGGAVCEEFGLRMVRNGTVLEGGSVCSDGEGTVLTTRECLLNGNRNGGMGEWEMEGVLRRVLGAEKVVWLEEGAAFDGDTDGHVDNMAVFARPGRVLLLWAGEGVCKEQYRRSVRALETLKGCVDAKGRILEVVLVPMGGMLRRGRQEAEGVERVAEGVAKRRREGERICASYVNFVIAEGVVFAPAFGDSTADEQARKALVEGFEGRKEIVMVPAREFVLSGGGLHCLSLGVAKSPSQRE